ncbi:hypothetical protein BGX34_003971 [Mortierella sp. NVP85]|nr:hypothetical protein BGX34_003971 [Mortierella sp. NVP85]
MPPSPRAPLSHKSRVLLSFHRNHTSLTSNLNINNSTGKGSFTDTLKGYVHDAITKGQEALHKVQEQFTQAGQVHSKTAGTISTGAHDATQANDAFAEVSQFNANCAADRPGSTGAHSATERNTDDAFAEVNQFNANCAAQHPAGSPGFKSSKDAM